MAIQYPIRVSGTGAFLTIRDSTDRAIAGGLLREDAEEIVNALNSQPKKKSKKIQIEEALRRSDLSAQIVNRQDIEYGPHDSLPRGEHVFRLQKNSLNEAKNIGCRRC